MITLEQIGHFCLAASLIFYNASFIPQMIKNYRLKSGSGLSPLFLLCYLFAYTFFLAHIYALHLAVSYRIFAPIELCFNLVLISQRLYYNGIRSNKALIGGVVAAFCLAFWLSVFGWFMPNLVGKVAGWMSLLFFTLYHIPQVYKIFKEKSVQGFSLGLVSLVAIANVLELTGSLILDLPLSTILIPARGLIIFAIYCYQFYHYSSYKY